MEIISKTIPCRLIASEEFTPEVCKQLLNTDLSHLIELVTLPINNVGSLKIEAFKLGFEWIHEKEWITFTWNNFRTLKVSIQGRWIQVNPKVKEEDYAIRECVFSLLELIPDSFSMLLGNEPTNLKELKERLEILPF